MHMGFEIGHFLDLSEEDWQFHAQMINACKSEYKNKKAIKGLGTGYPS